MFLDHPIFSASDHTPFRPQNQLVPCVYIALRCQYCGELRQALAAAPSLESVACPVCNATCNFVLLGHGLTKSQLPFHELHPREQTRWITHDPDNDDPSAHATDVYTPDTHNPDLRNPETGNPNAHSEEARNAESNEPQALDGS
jgi:hypothetical protein